MLELEGHAGVLYGYWMQENVPGGAGISELLGIGMLMHQGSIRVEAEAAEGGTTMLH